MHSLGFFVPPFRDADPRFALLIGELERQFPGRALSWLMVFPREEASAEDRHSYRMPPSVAVANAQVAFAEALASGSRAVLMDARRSPKVSFMVDPGESFDLANGERMSRIEVMVPADALVEERGLSCIASCGDALAAHHMHYNSEDAHGLHLLQYLPEADALPPLAEELAANPCLAALPRLSHAPADVPSSRVPFGLGEWNYWSAGVTRLLGPMRAPEDAEWLACSLQTPSGGTVLRLADGRFDIRSPEHCAQLLRAYRRFSGVGTRRG